MHMQLSYGYGSHDIFFRETAGEQYDAIDYSPGTYGSFIWDLERRILVAAVESLRQCLGRLKYLDFASGTGRVLAAVQPLVAEAHGIDVSGPMLKRAANKVPAARLIQGDLLLDPALASYDYDLITAFRFFLNTDAHRRLPALRSLANRLRNEHSILVFNIHGNAHGLDGVAALGNRHLKTMSLRDIQALTDEAGLAINSWYGVGLMPAFDRNPTLRRLARVVDAWAAQPQTLRSISRDLLFVCMRKE